MKRSFVGFALAGMLGLGVAFTVACSSSSTPAAPAVSTACNYSTLGYCIGYQGLNASQTTSANNSCASPGAVVSSCTQTGLVGSCSYSSGGLTAISYYYCPQTSTTATAACSAVSGTWTAGSTTCSTGGADSGTTTPDDGGGPG
jgi:hypothetical protein